MVQNIDITALVIYANFFPTAPPKSRTFMDIKTSIQFWANNQKQKLTDGEKRTIELSNEEASDLIKSLESFAREAVGIAEEYEKLKFHCAYGDYAAKICTDLKARPRKCAQLEFPVNTLAEKITQEETILFNGRGPFYNTPVLDALDERASELKTNSVTVDLGLAKFAMRAYSARNQACHSKGLLSGDCDLMAEAIEDGIRKLPSIISDENVVAMWTKILVYFRERKLMRNEFGSWSPVGVTEHHAMEYMQRQSSEVEIVLPDYEGLSRAAKVKLVDFVKTHKDEFDISFFYPQPKAKGTRKTRTYSDPESHHRVQWGHELIPPDRALSLEKATFEELANTKVKNGPPMGSVVPKLINQCYDSLHQEVCRFQDRLYELSRTESEMVLTKRLEELQKRCQKAIKRAENHRKDEDAKARRATRKAGKTASSTA